jgi:hypothetical protein
MSNGSSLKPSTSFALNPWRSNVYNPDKVPGTELPYLVHVSLVSIEVLATLQVEAGLNEDSDPQSSGSDVPKWKRNVRNVLQYRKNTGDIRWNRKGEYLSYWEADPATFVHLEAF